MKLVQILEGLDYQCFGADLEAEIPSICYNSLLAVPGCAFVAIRGFKTDGHKYVPSAADKGAAVYVNEGATLNADHVSFIDNTIASLKY